MTRQWIRQCRLVVGDGGAGLDLSALRIRFTVNQAIVGTPGNADIIVSNLSDATANTIQQEYTRVVLDAGYEENIATIFEGEIVQKRKGRENPTDTYLAILGREAQKAHSYATISKTLAAGHTFRDQVDACLEALKPFGVVAGFIDDLGSFKMPRGRALFGMVRDQLRTIASATDTAWRVQGNKLTIVKNKGTLPGSAIVMNSRTGMVGMPVQTMDGIEVRCLLNPEIKPGTRIQIDQSSIQQQQISLNNSAGAQNERIPSLATDGIYKVLKVTHSGDTRGNDWYSDLVCMSASGGPIPRSAIQLLSIPD